MLRRRPSIRMFSLIAHEGDAGLGKERRGRSRSDPASGRAADDQAVGRAGGPLVSSTRSRRFSEACQESGRLDELVDAAELFGQNGRFVPDRTVPVSDPDVCRPNLPVCGLSSRGEGRPRARRVVSVYFRTNLVGTLGTASASRRWCLLFILGSAETDPLGRLPKPALSTPCRRIRSADQILRHAHWRAAPRFFCYCAPPGPAGSDSPASWRRPGRKSAAHPRPECRRRPGRGRLRCGLRGRKGL